MILNDAWIALRHGGNLLSPSALASLPEPPRAPRALADELRAALTAFRPSAPRAEALGELLDVILERACGLREGWQKGSQLGASASAKLLDGTVQKPRRAWTGPGGETLFVFTTDATRLGLGKGRRPVAQVVEYIRRRRAPLAVLTNGAQLRLIWADADSLAWVEWEAERFVEAEQLTGELEALRRVLSPSALTRGETDLAPLLAAVRETRRGQAVLSKELGERVRRAVETLLRSRGSAIGEAWGEHSPSNLYVAACHFVMRLVVTLFAEARELLPVESPVYHQAYGIRGLFDQLSRLGPERRRARQMAFPRLLALFRLLHRGSPHPALTLPRYGGDLFQPGDAEGNGVQRALALLESRAEPPSDEVIHNLLALLTRTEQRVREGSTVRKVAAPVDFTELTSEYIGILYEGLLDYELHRAGEHPVIFLNLGDQPALPLDRLEAMDDKTLAALVDKAKVKRAAAVTESDDEGEDDDASEDEPEEELEAQEEDTEEDDAEPEAEAPEDDVLSLEDERAAALARAHAWARRAAEVGKLVKKPRGKKTDALAKYEADLESAAKQLIWALELPGELYLVRWGGTRKGAGTFYTRPQLTMPTVRRTLEPLVRDEAGQVREPEALLALKVCDPAMGSGSFLVAGLRVLTEAVVESLHAHGRITRINGRTTVHCELFPEADRTLPTEGFEERLEAIVRRAVVEHCLYGVDFDPLAVELARVALWVETLDRRLPFTFLDHKLRCGNALIGTWLDRFRDYPLLAFERQSPDLKYSGVHHEADVWHQALKEARKSALAEQAEILSGQLRLTGAAATDEELAAAVERVRKLYRRLRAVPAGRPDERARIWREHIQSDPALTRVRQAFDTWCALWFWPLDEIGSIPTPRELHTPTEAALARARELREEHRFFHWELEFPDVFTEQHAGFDAIVGNPPWETLQPQSKEFFTNHDPLYRAYGKQEGLRVQKELFDAVPEIEREWLEYTGGFKDLANFMKHSAEPFGDGKVVDHGGGSVSLVRGKRGEALHKDWRTRRARRRGLSDPDHPFRHQGEGKAYTYKLFSEAAHALLRAGGQLGLITPSGLYTDKGTGELRKLLLERCGWRWLYGFENRKKLFDIDSRFKFCVVIAEKGGATESIQTAFMRHDLEDWAEAAGALAYPAERIAAFSPKSLSVLEIRSEKDLAVLTKLYENGVLLGDDGPNGWGIKYAQGDFNMTSDSKLFIPREKAEAQGFSPDVYGRWVNADGEVLLPLYQGGMLWQLDPYASQFGGGSGHAVRWNRVNWGSTDKRFSPQYLVHYNTCKPESRRIRLAFRYIANPTNQRTMVAAAIPGFPAGHTVGIGRTQNSMLAIHAAAILSSLTFDSVMRLGFGGSGGAGAVDPSKLTQFPVPTSAKAASALRHLPLSLNAAGIEFAYFWMASWKDAERSRNKGWRNYWGITIHERLRIRCMLDAIIGVLYGLDRDDFAWILKDCDHPAPRLAEKGFSRTLDPKGFWRVDKAEDPELRHTVLSLVAFDDLTAAIEAAGGDRDAGIEAFCAQNDGDGWMLPETLRIRDLGLTRTVDVGQYDERALSPQPVRSRMGERFLDWQLAQSPEESWAECERHAKILMESMPAAPASGSEPSAPTAARSRGKRSKAGVTGQGKLFDS